MEKKPTSLSAAALQVLTTPEPLQKVDSTQTFVRLWRDGHITEIGHVVPPDVPPLPPRPILLPRSSMPKRPKGSLEGRIAFVHAIAHIEFIAMNLAWDIIARFTSENLPHDFYNDWVGVAQDESEHFSLLQNRLKQMGCSYGDLPAHDGLWEAAVETADDVVARLAIVPMVLEARGLDTTPKVVNDLRASGDNSTADIMEKIGNEEIPHVRAGVRWFEYLCARHHTDAVSTFRAIVTQRFKGNLKPPFNSAARHQAGMRDEYFLQK